MKTYKLLIFAFIITVFPMNSFSALPDIAKAIETKRHQGTREEMLSFIENRQIQTIDFAAESKILSSRPPILQDKKP